MSHGQISNEEQANYERQIAEQWQYTEEFKAEIEAIMSGEKGLSFSSLKAFLTSPMHFYRYKTDKKTTDAMAEGTAFHMAVLQPEKFKETYFVLDDTEITARIGGARPTATKEYKAWMETEIASNPGRIMLSQDKYDLFLRMRSYLTVCSATKDIMTSLKFTEKPFTFDYEGFKITGQIDGGNDEYIVDLKKVADASIQKVKWTVRDMLLDMQASIYLMAEKKEKYFLIFIDNDCNVSVVKLCMETIAQGLAKFDGAINGFRRCAEEDLFFSSYEFWQGNFIEL